METDRVTPMKENKDKHLAKEFYFFDATGQRTTNIGLLLDALKSIPPMSVESERGYTAAGLCVTKLRTRLSNRSVDRLCLLKSLTIVNKLTVSSIVRFLLNERSLLYYYFL